MESQIVAMRIRYLQCDIHSIKCALHFKLYNMKVRKLTAAIRYGMEDIAGARSLLETNSGVKDDPDTNINYGCLLYKVHR